MKNIFNTIGKTPLIKIDNIYAKLETVNPSGSVKDRIALFMTEKAEREGLLKPGYTIIEATSGNTGVSFSMIAAARGYKMIAVMPEDIGIEKRKLMEAFGAKFILTPKAEGFSAAIEKTRELAKEYDRVWLPKQFENPDNVEAHQKTTGQELLKQIKRVDAFTAGVGTGGTLIGVAKALKRKFSKVKIFAVEAAETPHYIEGISDGIIPEILDFSLIDGLIRIKSEDAVETSSMLAKKYGLFVGISSGANVLAAKRLSQQYKNVITILPDRGERYLNGSTK